MTERDLGLTFTAFTTFPADTLPEGQMIYVTVTASDAAGMLVNFDHFVRSSFSGFTSFVVYDSD